jgi:hypothetical protein
MAEGVKQTIYRDTPYGPSWGRHVMSLIDIYEQSYSSRFSRNRNVMTVVLLAALLLVGFIPFPAAAHSPSSVTLSYNFATQNLTVSISHTVSSSSHYIKTVTIYRNSNQVASHPYASQPGNSFSYYYTVTASDGDILSAKADCSIGGSGTNQVKVIAPDTTKPTVQITSPANDTEVTTETITVSGTASDNKGLDKVQVQVNDGTWMDASGKTSWTSQVTLLEGSNIIRAKAIDTSSNEAVSWISVVYNATPPPDETPPVVEILSPSDEADFDVGSITVSGSSSDNEDIAKVEVRVNSGSWTTAAGTITWTVEVTLAEGNNTIEARATDTSDNTGLDQITVSYNPQAPPDSTPPVVTIEAPSAGVVLSMESITVSGTASDDRGLSVVEARVNMGSWNTATGTTSWSLKLTLVEGMNTIEARAMDDSGNTGSDSVEVEYDPGDPPDTENPVIVILSPVDDAVFDTPDITVAGTASDNSCPCRVEVSLDGGNWMMATGRQTWSIDVILTPGPNSIEARAIDDSGNIGFDTVRVVYDDMEPVDTILPEIAISSPADGATVDDQRVTIRGAASDNKGLDVVEVKLNEDSWRMAAGTTSWSIDLDLDEGLNTISAVAIDLAGNEKEVSISVTYEPPYEPGSLDGIVQNGEYRGTASFDGGNFLLFWDFQGDVMNMALKAKTAGWVSIGFDPSSKMKDADMVLGLVDDSGRVYVVDAFSTGENGPHPADTDLGGTDDIIDFGGTESDGWTTIEFSRLANSTDLYDRNVWNGQVIKVIWAYSLSDEFTGYHEQTRGFVADQDFGIGAPVGDDDDDNTGGGEDEETSVSVIGIIMIALIIVVVVIAILIGIAIGIFLFVRGRKKEEGSEEEHERPESSD